MRTKLMTMVMALAMMSGCGAVKALSRPDETPAAEQKKEVAKPTPAPAPAAQVAQPAANPALSIEARIADAQRREKEALEATKVAEERARNAALEKRVKEAEERAREAEERRKEAEARAKALEESRNNEKTKGKDVVGENLYTQVAIPGNDVLADSVSGEPPMLMDTGIQPTIFVDGLPDGMTKTGNTRWFRAMDGLDLANVRPSGKKAIIAMPTIKTMAPIRARSDGGGVYFKQFVPMSNAAVICGFDRMCQQVEMETNGTFLVTVTMQGKTGELTRQMRIVNPRIGGSPLEDVLLAEQTGFGELWSSQNVVADGYSRSNSAKTPLHFERQVHGRVGRVNEAPVLIGSL